MREEEVGGGGGGDRVEKGEADEAATKIVNAEKELNEFDGPLMSEVKGELDRLRAQRQVFHSGNFNGPDLEKLFTIPVIERLVAVLSPRRFTVSDSNAVGKNCRLGPKLPPVMIGDPCSTSCAI